MDMELDITLIAGIVVALLIVVATVLFLRQAGGTSVPRESVLLVGPASGGKTTLLSLLCNGAPPTHGTVTSMVSGLAFSLPYHTHTLPLLTASKFLLNRCASCHECGKAPHRANCLLKDASAAKKGEPVSIPMIDIPGHSRLRGQLLLSHAPGCKMVLFVVDSVAFAEELSDVAELLYDAMVLLPGRPFLIVCNKQDLFFRSSKPDVVQTRLEAEFNVIKKTRAGTLESTDDGEISAQLASAQLGAEGTMFKFADLPDQPVKFIPFIANSADKTDSGSGDLTPIFEWLASNQ